MAALAKIGPGSNAASPAEMAFRRFRTGIQLTDIVLLSGSGFRLFSDGLSALSFAHFNGLLSRGC